MDLHRFSPCHRQFAFVGLTAQATFLFRLLTHHTHTRQPQGVIIGCKLKALHFHTYNHFLKLRRYRRVFVGNHRCNTVKCSLTVLGRVSMAVPNCFESLFATNSAWLFHIHTHTTQYASKAVEFDGAVQVLRTFHWL